jgi:hypothetical protein
MENGIETLRKSCIRTKEPLVGKYVITHKNDPHTALFIEDPINGDGIIAFKKKDDVNTAKEIISKSLNDQIDTDDMIASLVTTESIIHIVPNVNETTFMYLYESK